MPDEKEKLKLTTMKLEPSLLAALEEARAALGFKSRVDVLRHACRRFFDENSREIRRWRRRRDRAEEARP